MPASAITQDNLHERILTALRDAKKPVSFKALAKQVKTTDDSLRAALEAAGEVYRWPDFRRSQYFWYASPEEKAREAILESAATHALSKSDLSKAAAKHLPGFPVKRVAAAVADLLAASQLQAVPGFKSRSKLLVRTGESVAYFSTARAFVEAKIRSAGFDPAAFFGGNPPPPEVDASALLLEAVRTLEPVAGVPVSTLRLRNHLPQLAKPEFDAAALELRRKQAVFLSLHADPYNLSGEDKSLLIDGQNGTYYVAIAIR
jgi:hypothetical protein